MADDLLKKLRVETLKPQHLTKLDSRVASTELLGLQASLVGDWIAQLEQRFPDLLPSRSPRCLVALDALQPSWQLLEPGSAPAAECEFPLQHRIH